MVNLGSVLNGYRSSNVLNHHTLILSFLVYLGRIVILRRNTKQEALSVIG